MRPSDSGKQGSPGSPYFGGKHGIPIVAVENKWKTSPTCQLASIHRVLAGLSSVQNESKLWDWAGFIRGPNRAAHL